MSTEYPVPSRQLSVVSCQWPIEITGYRHLPTDNCPLATRNCLTPRAPSHEIDIKSICRERVAARVAARDVQQPPRRFGDERRHGLAAAGQDRIARAVMRMAADSDG